jgi:hypothetical protein
MLHGTAALFGAWPPFECVRTDDVGRGCRLDPGQVSEMAEVATMRNTVLVNTAGQRKRNEQRTCYQEARQRGRES